MLILRLIGSVIGAIWFLRINLRFRVSNRSTPVGSEDHINSPSSLSLREGSVVGDQHRNDAEKQTEVRAL